nr:Adenylate cyclase [Salmonella sp. NCTC 7297]
MIEALKTILGKMHQDAAPPDSVEVFCLQSASSRPDSHPRPATGLRMY